MASEEFEFVNSIATKLGKRAEANGIEALNDIERTVLLIWWASGIIGNGGFQYFFEGATEAAEVAEAFDRAGCTAAAAACRQALQVFPGGIPPIDQQERCDFLDSVQDQDHDLFLELDEVIWATSDDGLEARLIAYIEDHRDVFADLL